jgi:exonuclease SbcD
MSMSEKDYRHSIVVIDFDAAGTVGTDLVPTPRSVAFLRVPSIGAAPLENVEAELRSLEIDDLGEERRPFLEVVVTLSSAEPDLRLRIDAALAGKPARLTRIVRETGGRGGVLADALADTAALGDLEPTEVFARRHVEEYGTVPPAELKTAFDEILAGVLSRDAKLPDSA